MITDVQEKLGVEIGGYRNGEKEIRAEDFENF